MSLNMANPRAAHARPSQNVDGAAPVAGGTSGPNSVPITDNDAGNVIQWWTAHTTLVAVDNSVNDGGSNVHTDNSASCRPPTS
jgi:hypothetical protein